MTTTGAYAGLDPEATLDLARRLGAAALDLGTLRVRVTALMCQANAFTTTPAYTLAAAEAWASDWLLELRRRAAVITVGPEAMGPLPAGAVWGPAAATSGPGAGGPAGVLTRDGMAASALGPPPDWAPDWSISGLPAIDSPDLHKFLEQLYRARSSESVGDGSTADAVRWELITGGLTQGVTHLQKGIDSLGALRRILLRSDLTENDRAVAELSEQHLRYAFADGGVSIPDLSKDSLRLAGEESVNVARAAHDLPTSAADAAGPGTGGATGGGAGGAGGAAGEAAAAEGADASLAEEVGGAIQELAKDAFPIIEGL